MNNQDKTFYKEIQKSRQWWFMGFIGILVAMTWYGAIRQLVFKIPFGSNPASNPLMLGIWIVAGILFPFFLLSLRLETSIKRDGIYIRFIPFHFKPQKFLYSDISSYKSVTYNPIREYGGWGIRWGRTGKAYSVSGNKGLLLEFTNGKKLLIGSVNPQELERKIPKNLA